jgi:hypothetical protein
MCYGSCKKNTTSPETGRGGVLPLEQSSNNFILDYSWWQYN